MLPVHFGFHSDAMRPLLDDLRQFAQCTVFNAPTIPVASTVTGEIVMPGDTSIFNADYVVNHCLNPVLFDRAINAILPNSNGLDINAWIEIGPHVGVLPLLKRNPLICPETLLLPSLRKERDPWFTLTSSLSELYVTTAEVVWREIFSHLPTVSCVKLPSYPFLKNKFWIPFQENPQNRSSFIDPQVMDPTTDRAILHSWLQYPCPPNGQVAIFHIPISKMARSILGHKVAGSPLCPASVYIDQVYGGIELMKRNTFVLTDEPVHFRLTSIEFINPLVYDRHIDRSVRTHITLDKDHECFTIASLVHPATDNIVHVQGKLQSRSTYDTKTKFSRILPTLIGQILNLIELHNREQLQHFSSRTVYDVILSRVVEYSESYRTIRSITVSRDGTEAYATAKLSTSHEGRQDIVDPAFMDTLLHAAGLVANLQGDASDVFICSEVDSVEVLPDAVDSAESFGVYCRSSWTVDQSLMIADAYAVQLTHPWRIVAHLRGMRFRRVRFESLKRGLSLAGGISHYQGPASPRSLSHQIPPRQKSSCATHSRGGAVDDTDMLQVISDTCGIDAAQNRHMDLASLGIDSLMTIELIQNLRNACPEVAVQPHHFIPSRSIQDILTDICAGPSSPLASSSEISSGASSPTTLVYDDAMLEKNISNTGHESDVKRILASVLGLDVTEFEDDANFEALGLDSLASMEALYELQKEFELSLPRHLFADCSTVRSVNAFLASHRSSAENVKITHPSTRQYPVNAGLRPREILVPIQVCHNSNSVPLLLIHDGSGLINSYDRLPSLHRSVWAIHNPKIITGETWGSLHDMAAEYAQYASETISGPLIVGGQFGNLDSFSSDVSMVVGWSFGGVVAFEIARILLAKGVTVKGVLLIDSPSPLNHVPLSDELIDCIVNLDGRSACVDTTALLKSQFATNSRLLASYDPFLSTSPWPAVVLLHSSEGFRPRDLCVPEWLSDRTNPQRLCGGWEAVVGPTVRVLPIPGNHFQSFDPLHVRPSRFASSELT